MRQRGHAAAGDPKQAILDGRRYVPGNSPSNVVRSYEDCVEMIRLFRKISYISLDCNLGIPKMQAYAWEGFPGAELIFNPL